MSLLLEALKKAEKAKEDAQRRAGRDDAPGDTGPGLRAGQPLELIPEPSPEPAKPVMTRSELPDISQPLEILTDDIAPRPAAAAGRPADPGSRPAGRKTAQEDAASRTAKASGPERAAARAVFEAKYREPNPRLPFYITMGVLAVAAVCTTGYFWYQLRPPAPLVNANPPRTTEAAGASGLPSTPASGPIVAATAAPATPAASAIPGLPSTPAPPAAIPPRPSAPSPTLKDAVRRAPAPQPAAVRFARAPGNERPAPAPAAPEAKPEVRVERAAPQVHPQVQAAYAAYQAGDLPAARAGYEAALRDEASNRDALLGLAAVHMRGARFRAAETVYQQLLRADPRDAHAQAGLLALRQGRGDPLATESRVKSLLSADPDAHVLHFTLGNELARQGRWPEAQQQYFKAFSGDAANADYAYNLAVSLDHLRQPRLALQYYERALALAAGRAASFDDARVRRRVEELGR